MLKLNSSLKFLFLIFCLKLAAYEKIHMYKALVDIHKDSTITVTENIVVNSEGKDIKRGIRRDIPLAYKDKYGNEFNVSLDFISATRNGHPVPYQVENYMNGKRIYLMNPGQYLEPGVYDFQLNYNLNRQLYFGKEFDELYYNVVGNGWDFEIDKAIAIVTLPKVVSADSIGLYGYTGRFGTKGTDYTSKVLGNGSIYFETTRVLRPNEAFTISVTFPKAVVEELTFIQKIEFFFKDNFKLLLGLLFFLLVVFLMLWVLLYKLNNPDQSKIIPLFEAPQDFSPWDCAFLYEKKPSSIGFTSLIIALAQKKLISIKEESGWLGQNYMLRKLKSEEPSNLSDIEDGVLDHIFLSGKDVKVKRSGSFINAYSYFVRSLVFLEEKYINCYYFYKFIGALTSIAAGILLVKSDAPLGFMLTGLLVVLCILFFKSVVSYTDEGKDLAEKVLGFRMFLNATEKERLRILSAPTQTIELYEKYLPYAVALGCEVNWTRQFAPLFANLAKEGHAYTPYWYYGSGRFYPDNFATNLSTSFSSSISSASSAPGSSSGGGGGGSAGGGSSGGGGGGC